MAPSCLEGVNVALTADGVNGASYSFAASAVITVKEVHVLY
jgi:hypothetical protein